MTARETASGRLAAIREDPRNRWFATAAGAVLGLLAATVDPLGLFLGGALVAMPARDVPRGLLAAGGFGVLVLATFLLRLLAAGSVGPALGLGLPFWLAIGIGIGLSLLGGLVRAVL